MTMLDATAAPLGADARAFVLLKSRRRLDLLNPDPQAWTDDDLAGGLSRTMRWGGASRWAHPLSVAQHSLTVLAIREAEGPLTARGGLARTVGWSRTDMVKALGTEIHPLLDDPLPPNGFARLEPCPPPAAQDLFMERFRELADASRSGMSPSRKPGFGRATSHPATPS